MPVLAARKPFCTSRPARQAVVVNAQRISFAQQAGTVAASVVLSAGLACTPAFAASVAFSGVKDGATVSSPVHLDFTVSGMTVAPAVEGLKENSGHFHVVVDEAPVPIGEIIPFDATHLHYGKGQTSADVELAPGKHKLSLQFANAMHESYGPELTQTITISVK